MGLREARPIRSDAHPRRPGVFESPGARRRFRRPAAVTKPMATVIPVPTLPLSVPAARFTPVVRTSQNVVPRRFARGTEKHSEETVRTNAAPPPANDDVTRPGIVLPESGRVAR